MSGHDGVANGGLRASDPAISEHRSAQPPLGSVEEVHARFRRPLLAYFRKRTTSGNDAEDLTQQVFVRLFQRIKADGIEMASSYIYTVAANLMRDESRRIRRKGTSDHLDLFGEEGSEAATGVTDGIQPERILLARERLSCVLGALDSASQRTHDIFLLYRLEGLKQKEIAAMFNISVSAVEKHIVRALSQIANAMNQYDAE